MGISRTFKRLGGLRVAWPGMGLVILLGLVAGCETKSFFDPSEVGRYEKRRPGQPLVLSILKNLDTGVEEPDERFASATPPRPSDQVAAATDYVIGRNDLVQVSVTDLVAPGVETQKVMRVSESGFISLPLVGQVKAAGLTEAQLEEAIVAAYRDANLIQRAQVSVVTVEARNRTFSIMGAVTQPGQYAIVDSNFRLLDALVLARDVTSPTGIEYLYVVRRLDRDATEAPGTEPAPVPGATTQPAPDVLMPRAAAPVRGPKMMMDSAEGPATEPATQPAGAVEGRTIVVDDKPMQIEGGKMVPAPGAEPMAPEEPAAAAPSFTFNDLREPADVRVIRVPYDQLKRGELRYNIVVRPQDLIIVPQPMIGEYYMGGHVARTGVYSLTARNITLKQAVIAAGMLDQLAIPARTQIVRRLGSDHEIFARVDLDKIFAGEEPDIMLKPDDQVMVGTNALAPFLAAFRSGFRLTYGFGFIYDRNYWDTTNP